MKIIIIIMTLISLRVNAEAVGYTGFPLGSWHVNSESDLQEFNPGISSGLLFGYEETINYGIEAGLYYNSFREITTYASVSIDYNVITYRNSNQLRFGTFLGIFKYPNLTNKTVSIGEYVLVGGLQMKYRINDKVEMVMGYVPIQLISNDSDALITFKINIIR